METEARAPLPTLDRASGATRPPTPSAGEEPAPPPIGPVPARTATSSFLGTADSPFFLSPFSLLPSSCPESQAIARLDEARREAMPFLSRRRAVPELDENLVTQPWPEFHQASSRPPVVRQPTPCTHEGRSWPIEAIWRPEALVKVREWLAAAQRRMQALASKASAPERGHVHEQGSIGEQAKHSIASDGSQPGQGTSEHAGKRAKHSILGDSVQPGQSASESHERVKPKVSQSDQALPPIPPTLVLSAEEVLQPWAARHTWDCRIPTRCVPLLPSSVRDPVSSPLNGAFIRAAAEELRWADEDLVHQAEAGVDDWAEVSRQTILCFHHKGLEQRFTHAAEAVQGEIDAGDLEVGFADLPFVPCRLCPWNVAAQNKYRLVDEQRVECYVKYRLTTDDSWDAKGMFASRNACIDEAAWADLELPSTRDLALAAAILAQGADAAGVPLVAWARDLSRAYRAWGVQRMTLPLQCLIWTGGVSVLNKLAFGTASAPGVFQRLASLLISLVRRRQDEWDRAHLPTHPALRAWLRRRGSPSMGYTHQYLDDSNGVVINDVGSDWPKGRAHEHFRIAGEVFRAAGFEIPEQKDQLGEQILTLGFRLDLRPAHRCVTYPPEKVRVILELIERLLDSLSAERTFVEQVVGILGHLCTVVPEGKIFLDAGYALACARRRAGSGYAYKPQRLRIGGQGRTAVRFRDALRWFQAVLHAGIRVPLAPRAVFPAVGEDGCAFIFKDASREWGVGGWTLMPGSPPVLYLLAEAYPAHLAEAARSVEGSLSTAALELAAAVITARALRRRVAFLSLVIFTDSEAARGAINSGGSGTPAIVPLLAALFDDETQHLAVRVSTDENAWADGASRGRAARVSAEARALGWQVVRLECPPADWGPLEESLLITRGGLGE